jgi:anti-sigma regulatory factor (Ser/Thr protein kinase)
VQSEVKLKRTRSTASELRLPARRSELGLARQYAREAAAAFGLDADASYQFVYAVNEAVTNAIRHGVPDGQGMICLSVVADAERLTFTVQDHGTFVAVSPELSFMSERGRGFALMASLTDEVELCVEPGRTTVRLSKVAA